MDKIDKKLKTFCPLLWNHISANSQGIGQICCEGGPETLKNNQGQKLLWKESSSLHSYFNSENHKVSRKRILKGERLKHCFKCFNQEDHGVKSPRMQYIDQYQSDLKEMINSTNDDGSINKPKIAYVDMALGNKCNLKCRMCNPWSSYIIGKDWKKMGRAYDDTGPKNILKDKWYASSNTLQMIKEALPYIQDIFTTGGEPMLIKEHLKNFRNDCRRRLC